MLLLVPNQITGHARNSAITSKQLSYNETLFETFYSLLHIIIFQFHKRYSITGHECGIDGHLTILEHLAVADGTRC